MASITLKVSTEALKSKASEVEKLVGNMKTSFSELEETIARTSHYWIGEAGDAHRKQYQDQKDDVDDMLKRLGEHPKDLLTMAGIYETVERDVENIGMSLSDNVIS